MTRRHALIPGFSALVLLLAAAPNAAAQGGPKGAKKSELVRPAGSMLRCKDGRWAPPQAQNSWCATHGGVLVRFADAKPVPAAKKRPEGKMESKKALVPPPRITPPPASAQAKVPVGAATSDASGSKAANTKAAGNQPVIPGPTTTGHTMMCKDKTLLTGSQDPKRCDGHGGVELIFPLPQTKRP